MFRKFITLILDILYPLACVVCNRPDAILCQMCSASMPVKPQKIIRPTEHLDYVMVSSNYAHLRVHTVIKNFKYQGITALAEPLADMLCKTYAHQHEGRPTLIPIPLHWRKERARGYNQSRLLAELVAQKTQLPIAYGLKRIRYTKSQSKLGRLERKTNVSTAFRYDGMRAPRQVLLIDDITTTYSTLESAAAELKKKGARTVGALVVARSHPSTSSGNNKISA